MLVACRRKIRTHIGQLKLQDLFSHPEYAFTCPANQTHSKEKLSILANILCSPTTAPAPADDESGDFALRSVPLLPMLP